MVTITDQCEADVNGKNLVIVMARSHPSDSATSYIVQGMMEFLTSNHGIAKDMRQNITFKIIPMMNPDGVLLGNTRCTLLGADLNRSWDNNSPHQHPILYAVKELIMESSEVRLSFNLWKENAHSIKLSETLLRFCD